MGEDQPPSVKTGWALLKDDLHSIALDRSVPEPLPKEVQAGLEAEAEGAEMVVAEPVFLP